MRSPARDRAALPHSRRHSWCFRRRSHRPLPRTRPHTHCEKDSNTRHARGSTDRAPRNPGSSVPYRHCRSSRHTGRGSRQTHRSLRGAIPGRNHGAWRRATPGYPRRRCRDSGGASHRRCQTSTAMEGNHTRQTSLPERVCCSTAAGGRRRPPPPPRPIWPTVLCVPTCRLPGPSISGPEAAPPASRAPDPRGPRPSRARIAREDPPVAAVPVRRGPGVAPAAG